MNTTARYSHPNPDALLRSAVCKLLCAAIKHHGATTITVTPETLEIPPNPELGDFAFPCFLLSKELKKSPAEIAQQLAQSIRPNTIIESVAVAGPYVNFFISAPYATQAVMQEILSHGKTYGSSNDGKSRTITIDLSSPNIAKPFGIGHLRSTIIGNAIGHIASFSGYRVVRINYLGDWGTQFGKLIVGFEKFGDAKKLAANPIRHLLEIYVAVNKDPELDDQARAAFQKLEQGDKKMRALWKRFRRLSLKEFDAIYKRLGISFDVTSGESEYNEKLSAIVEKLKKARLLKESQDAYIVDLEAYGLGVSIIQKKDGTTLYATRDLAAAIDRQKRYHPAYMLYEVGAEQKLHFQQLFKILELLGYAWAKQCVHIDHGFYLDTTGKKFATRQGKTIFMEDILNETEALAEKELRTRYGEFKEIRQRARLISRAAIFYGDLKNHRSQSVVFDIAQFLSFEGNTGPYLLYTYARAQSILKKGSYRRKKFIIPQAISEREKRLILLLARFPNTIKAALASYAPNGIAQYAFDVGRLFNEYYHAEKVIGSSEQLFRLTLVDACAQTLKNALALLGIQTIDKM